MKLQVCRSLYPAMSSETKGCDIAKLQNKSDIVKKIGSSEATRPGGCRFYFSENCVHALIFLVGWSLIGLTII